MFLTKILTFNIYVVHEKKQQIINLVINLNFFIYQFFKIIFLSFNLMNIFFEILNL